MNGQSALQARSPVLSRFHPRRLAAWVVAAPVLGAAAWAVLQPSTPGATVAALLIAGLGAATLADYVPTTGRRPEIGCGSCAVVAGLSVPAAVVLGAGVGPLLGVAVAAGGLLQRLRQPPVCPT